MEHFLLFVLLHDTRWLVRGWSPSRNQETICFSKKKMKERKENGWMSGEYISECNFIKCLKLKPQHWRCWEVRWHVRWLCVRAPTSGWMVEGRIERFNFENKNTRSCISNQKPRNSWALVHTALAECWKGLFWWMRAMRGHTTLTLRVNSSSSTSVNDHHLNDTPERQTLLENQRKESVCEVFVDVQIWGSGGRRTEDGGTGLTRWTVTPRCG